MMEVLGSSYTMNKLVLVYTMNKLVLVEKMLQAYLRIRNTI